VLPPGPLCSCPGDVSVVSTLRGTPPYRAPVPDPLARVAGLPGVAEGVAQARAAVDLLLRHRLLRRRSAEVSAECGLRGARASAALEGVDVPLEDVRGELTAGGVVDPVVEAAVRLSSQVGGMTATWSHAPRQALARLHLLAVGAADVDGDPSRERVGRPRPDATAEDPLRLGPAPGPQEVAARLAGLSDALLAPTTAPAVVVAAVVHGELLALRAFGTRDGLVARAAARVVLVARGLDPKSVTAPEVGHLEAGGYAEAARAYVAGDVARWVVHCCGAVALGAREGLAVAEALQRAE